MSDVLVRTYHIILVGRRCFSFRSRMPSAWPHVFSFLFLYPDIRTASTLVFDVCQTRQHGRRSLNLCAVKSVHIDTVCCVVDQVVNDTRCREHVLYGRVFNSRLSVAVLPQASLVFPYIA